jgi:hypothetical protein
MQHNKEICAIFLISQQPTISRGTSKMNIKRPSNRQPISAGMNSKIPIIPQIHGGLPPRSQSEALHRTTPCDRMGKLLEDCSHPMSGCTQERQSYLLRNVKHAAVPHPPSLRLHQVLLKGRGQALFDGHSDGGCEDQDSCALDLIRLRWNPAGT